MPRNKKHAFLLGYNGKNYHGCQYNGEVETVEKTLIEGLLASEMIKECNALPSKVSLQRCSRTDAGVHASLNVFIAKTSTDPAELEEALRKYLAQRSIHLYEILRVSKSFHAQRACESRIYEYFLPTFFFGSSTYQSDWEKYASCLKSDSPTNLEVSSKLGTEDLERVRNMFQNYLGTHDYHNFTTSKNKKGTQRYIKSISVSNPFLREGVEYLKITIHGQSFLYNQIRKMIGYIVECLRYTGEFSSKVFSEEKVRVFTAPSEYLLLERPLFREKIKVRDNEIEEVKDRMIYTEVCKKENLHRFFRWVAYAAATTLNVHPSQSE